MGDSVAPEYLGRVGSGPSSSFCKYNFGVLFPLLVRCSDANCIILSSQCNISMRLLAYGCNLRTGICLLDGSEDLIVSQKLRDQEMLG